MKTDRGVEITTMEEWLTAHGHPAKWKQDRRKRLEVGQWMRAEGYRPGVEWANGATTRVWWRKIATLAT